MRAPSASAASLAHTTEGATALSTKAKVAKPQSAPAMTRSRPTALAKLVMRWAISRGCSTKLVVEFDDPWDQDLVIRDLGFTQIFPFMGVARISGLERQTRRPGTQSDAENLGERDVMCVRPFIITPAKMHTHRIGRNIRGGVVQRREYCVRRSAGIRHPRDAGIDCAAPSRDRAHRSAG